jgi:YesN/AraC family two-component response regulator
LTAENGEQALAIARSHEHDIHLLITDVVMPVMGGRELVEQMIRLRPETAVIYMSGYTDDAIVRRGLMDEGLAFIQKPFTAEALARKVRVVLDEHLVPEMARK